MVISYRKNGYKIGLKNIMYKSKELVKKPINGQYTLKG